MFSHPARGALCWNPAMSKLLTWQIVKQNVAFSTLHLAEVPGGWLLRNSEGDLFFLPDPEHTWDVERHDVHSDVQTIPPPPKHK
jgi:hypothetical protein